MTVQRRKVLGVLTGAAGSALLPRSLFAATAPATLPGEGANGPEKVTGIGGLFFRAHDPKGLAQWYQQHLGVTMTPESEGDPSWQQEAGPTVFAPFPEKTGYFGDPGKGWMVNFRVRNLDRMVAQLTAAGIVVKVDRQVYPNGRFARTHDPEGNPVELWEPSTPASAH